MDSINDIKKYGSAFAAKGVSSYSNVSSLNHTTYDASDNSNKYQNFSKMQNLEGEITDLKNNEISIRLDDNTIIKAKIYDTSNLSIGQSVKFKLQETSKGFVIESIKPNVSDTDTIISKALEGADLIANEKNISVVKALLENNMSIDKQTILKLLQESHTNKSVSLNSLVLMEKHNIPFSSENATQFENYRNYEHRIIKELDTISATIPDLIDTIAQNSNIDKLVTFNHQLINIICDYSDYIKEELPVSTAYFSPNDPEDLISILSAYDLDSDFLDEISFGTASLKDVSDAILMCLEQADEIDDYRVSTINEKNANAFTNIILAKDAFENPIIKTILDKYADIQRDNSFVASFMNNYNRAQLISKLRDIDNTLDLSTKIWKGSITSNELLQDLDTLFSYSNNNTSYRNFANSMIADESFKDVSNLLQTNVINSKLETLQTLFSSHNIQPTSSEINNYFGKIMSDTELDVLKKFFTSPQQALTHNELNSLNGFFTSMPSFDNTKMLNIIKDVFHSHNEVITLKDTEAINNFLSLSNHNIHNFDAIKKLILSPQYKTLIKETVINNWTISPNKLKELNCIETTYNKIYKQLTSLEDFVQKNLDATNDKLTSNIKDTKSNIDFMSTLNELFSYVQIPLKMRNQNVHSDLYVLTNKKKLKTDKNDINILLHLDMQYLGSLDVNIHLNNNVITSKFLVSDATSKALLETNMENLEFSLMEKGFLLNTSVEIQTEKFDLLNDFIEKDSPSTSLKRYTFDIRT